MAGVPRLLRAHRAREALLRSPGLARRPDPVDVKLACAKTEGGRRKAANGDSSLLKRFVDPLLERRECITAGHIFLCAETTLLEKERESITTGHGYFSLSR